MATQSTAWTDPFDLDESKIYEIDFTDDLGSGDSFDAGDVTWRAPDAEAAGFVLANASASATTVARVRISFPGATLTNKAEQDGKTYELEAVVAGTAAGDTVTAVGLLKICEVTTEDITTLLVVEDGTGVATANTYATVAEADAYFLSIGDTRWQGLSMRSKEQRLIRSTFHLDNVFRDRFLGLKANLDQALEHPRQLLYDHEGNELAVNVVQPGVKRALFEYAALSEIVSAQSSKADYVKEVSATTGTHVIFQDGVPASPIARRAVLHLSGLLASRRARLERIS